MAGYSKDFLIDAYCWRFEEAGIDASDLRELANTHYDRVGKDKFRTAASLDAEYIKNYKQYLKSV